MGDIVALVEKAAANIDAEKAMRTAEKMRKGHFDLTDMREQQRETQRMADKLAAILTATAKSGTRYANKAWVKKVMVEKRPVWIYPDAALAAGLVDEVVD